MSKQFCKHQHDTFVCGRDTEGHCFECKRIRDQNLYQRSKSCKKDYYQRTKENAKVRSEKYYTLNRERILVRCRKYSKEHPERVAQHNLKAHKKRHLRIPSFGQRGILSLYRNCPPNYVVDHRIPLIGKLVSGLHVSWNLQYITRNENEKKRNKFDGTLENNSWRSI